jgi:hypothetical protein
MGGVTVMVPIICVTRIICYDVGYLNAEGVMGDSILVMIVIYYQ